MTAYVGILQFTILMRSSHTLKDKRRILRSIKDRLSHRYNISIAEIEDAAIRQLFATTRGTRKELAQQLGLSERTLYRRLKALGLD